MKPINLSKNIRSLIALMLIGFVMIWLLLVLAMGHANPEFIDRTTNSLISLVSGTVIGFYFAANHQPHPTESITKTSPDNPSEPK